MSRPLPNFADFFAGSGLVTQGLKRFCNPVWSNDICPKKAEVYIANHGSDHFHLGSIKDVNGAELPSAEIVWASFPCQDLSLAGKMGGLGAARSGLFWEWLRVLDEMPQCPAVLAIENVVGLLSSDGGQAYRQLHEALTARSYRVGPMILDAKEWVPQSRQRVFIVAACERLDTTDLEEEGPNWIHPKLVTKAASNLDDMVFWSMPRPAQRVPALSEIIEWDAPVFEASKAEELLSLIPPRHQELLKSVPPSRPAVFPGYRRTRNGKQVLELRFDNISGCLRTAEGGSSRQFLVLHRTGKWFVRLITAREAALLMGAPKSYRLPGSYNESYNAMGDAVACPVVNHLAKHLLVPISQSEVFSTRRSGESNRLGRLKLSA